ncbi:hypothetical protein Plec18170_003867 [Paecilomyces lecythidis]
MDGATVLAVLLYVTEHYLRDTSFTSIIEPIIKTVFLSNFLFDVVTKKWLSLIMSTTAPEHGLFKTAYFAAFLAAYNIPTIGSLLCVDKRICAIVQLVAIYMYWIVFNRKEQNVRMYEEERDKWHEQLREMTIIIAQHAQDVEQNPTAERKGAMRAALAAMRAAKKKVREKERALFQGGYLRNIKDLP